MRVIKNVNGKNKTIKIKFDAFWLSSFHVDDKYKEKVDMLSVSDIVMYNGEEYEIKEITHSGSISKIKVKITKKRVM